MPVVDLLEFKNYPRKSPAGVYVISPDDVYEPNIRYKIGHTIDMKNRLNNYHICFNDGFFIYHALLLKKEKYPNRTKKQRETTFEMTEKLEKFVHNKLKDINWKTHTRTWRSEWFMTDSSDEQIKQALIDCHNEYKEDTHPPILQFEKPKYDKFFIDGIENVKKRIGIVEEAPSYLPENTTTRSGRVVKKSSKLKDYDYIDIKKRVRKKWS